MCRKSSAIAVIFILSAGAWGSWTYTFDGDLVIDGYQHTVGNDGSPWYENSYDTSTTWSASGGITTMRIQNSGSGSDGAALIISHKAANGSDGLAHTIDVRAARANNSWLYTLTDTGLGFQISAPVNSSTRKLYMLGLGNLQDVTDTDRLRVIVWSGVKGSNPDLYDINVPGLNVDNYNVYRMAMNAAGDLNIYVNDMNVPVYTQSTLPTYNDDGRKAYFGLVSPRDGDNISNWQMNLDYAYINATTSLIPYVTNPNPHNDGKSIDVSSQLYWSAGIDVSSHNVYLDTDFDNINNAVGDDSIFDLDGDGQKDANDFAVFASNWGRTDCNSSNNYCNGCDFGPDGDVDRGDLAVAANEWLTEVAFKSQVIGANSFNPVALELNKTYYWRIDEVNSPATWKGQLWQFSTTLIYLRATNPNPDDDTIDIPANAILSWDEPNDITDPNYNVYFGTNFSDVNGGSLSVLEANNIDTNSCIPASELVVGTQYYWRVDVLETSGPTHQGNVWDFVTLPLKAHKLPLPAYCDQPVLLEGEDFDSQSGGWADHNSWFTESAKNDSAGTGQYLEWNNLTIPAGEYELWFSMSRIGTVTAKDYKLYAGPNTSDMRQVANLNIAWGDTGNPDIPSPGDKQYMWVQMANDVNLLVSDTVIRWETSSTDKISLDAVQLSRIPETNVNFGKSWIRSHPLSIMGAVKGGEEFDIYQYQDSNMSTTLLWVRWNLDVLSDSDEAGLPWVFNVEIGSEYGWTELNQALKNHINSVYQENPAGCMSWQVWDEVGGKDANKWVDIKNWIKQIYPNTLVYLNAQPEQSSYENWGGPGAPPGYDYAAYLNDLVTTAQPDVLCYDHYPFGLSDTGNVFKYADDVSTAAKSGGIPYWVFVQSFGGDLNMRIPSESDIRMQVFVHLTYGFTGIQYFTYEDMIGVTMVDRHSNPRPLYYIVQALNREIEYLGLMLRSLTHQDAMYVPGKVGGNPNPVPSGATKWALGAGGDPYITNVDLDFLQFGNEGAEKSGCIGLFTDDANRRYFMLTNAYHDGSLNSTATELDFVVEFISDINSLVHYNRLTGAEEVIALTNNKLYVTLPGGTGNLYGYPLVPKATAPVPSNGQTSVEPDTTLSWIPGTGVAVHNVYFGTASVPVNPVAALPAAVTSYDPNNPANPSEPDLDFSTTYYWRVDEVNDPNTYTGYVWNFTTRARRLYADGPVPADNAINVDVNQVLSWLEVDISDANYKVYFGTDSTVANNPSTLRSEPNYDPTLANDTYYYWRVDALDPNAGGTEVTYQGSDWDFTTSRAPDAIDFECDEVVSGYSQTGADGSPWYMHVYDAVKMTNDWAVSSGIATIAGDNLSNTSDGAAIKTVPLAVDGSDGIDFEVTIRMARLNCDFASSLGKIGVGVEMRVPVNASTSKTVYLSLVNGASSDVDTIRVGRREAIKNSTPIWTSVDVTGLDVTTMNTYLIGMVGSTVTVSVNGTERYSGTHADYSDSGGQFYCGLLAPQTNDGTNHWEAQIDYIRIDP